MIVAICISVVVGMLIGRFFRDDENCPRRVLGYDCRGSRCDHRKSELYRNMMNMALGAEERERDKHKNLWGGGKHE